MFISQDGYVTSLANGEINKVKDGEVVHSVKLKPSHKQPLIKLINNEIFVVCFGNVWILNGELETIECFNVLKVVSPYEKWPRCADGNESYIVAGVYKGRVCFFARNGDEEPTVRTENIPQN